MNLNPSAGPNFMAPIPTPVPVTDPAATSSAAAVALAAHQSAETQAVALNGASAGTTDFVIKEVGNDLDSIVKSDRVRGKLDQVLEKIKTMDVREVEIKAYFPFISEGATPRAKAVAEYFEMNGLDKNLITQSPKGPGLGNKNWMLAKQNSVRIEIYGSPKIETYGNPKQDIQAQEYSPPAKRSVPPYMLA